MQQADLNPGDVAFTRDGKLTAVRLAPTRVGLFDPATGRPLAEFVTPDSGKSFAWTFGWFLRIAILTNAVFYFAIFSFFVYVVDRRRRFK